MRALVLTFPLLLIACASAPARSTSKPPASPAVAVTARSEPKPAPRLPEGWSTPDEAEPGRAVVRRTETDRLDLSAVPVVDVPRHLEAPSFGTITPPRDALDGPRATEVKTLGGRVTVAGHRFGGVMVGVGEMPFFDFAEGGTVLLNSHGVTQLAWTSFDGMGDGLAVDLVRGFYDAERRLGFEREHVHVLASPVVGGAFFAFRTRCAACAEGDHERLHLVGPGSLGNLDGGARREPAAGAPVAYVSLPLDPGTAGGAATFLGVADVFQFGRRTGAEVARPNRLPVGFFASRGAADAAPLVVVRTVGS